MASLADEVWRPGRGAAGEDVDDSPTATTPRPWRGVGRGGRDRQRPLSVSRASASGKVAAPRRPRPPPGRRRWRWRPGRPGPWQVGHRVQRPLPGRRPRPRPGCCRSRRCRPPTTYNPPRGGGRAQVLARGRQARGPWPSGRWPGRTPGCPAASPPSTTPPTRYSRPSRATSPPACRPRGSGASRRQRSPSRRASWSPGPRPSLPPATYSTSSRVAAMAWLTATGSPVPATSCRGGVVDLGRGQGRTVGGVAAEHPDAPADGGRGHLGPLRGHRGQAPPVPSPTLRRPSPLERRVRRAAGQTEDRHRRHQPPPPPHGARPGDRRRPRKPTR
jgi:hypothetical protein